MCVRVVAETLLTTHSFSMKFFESVETYTKHWEKKRTNERSESILHFILLFHGFCIFYFFFFCIVRQNTRMEKEKKSYTTSFLLSSGRNWKIKTMRYLHFTWNCVCAYFVTKRQQRNCWCQWQNRWKCLISHSFKSEIMNSMRNTQTVPYFLVPLKIIFMQSMRNHIFS